MEIRQLEQQPVQQQSKNITPMELYQLGISKENFNIFETLEQLKQNPPNIVIAECLYSIRFVQNKFHREQQLNKKSNYVMSAGVYSQLHWDIRASGMNGGNKVRNEILKPSKMQFKKIYRLYNGQDLDNKTILVTRQGGIGDLLFIQPNLIYLKQKYPTCTIKFACGPQYQSMIEEWDCIDEVLDLPFLSSELIQSDYHVIFEGVIERCKAAENICAYNLFSKWMGLDLQDELLLPKQEANEEYTIQVRDNLQKLGLREKEFIIVQMRASSPIRTPNPSVWKNLINLLTEKGHNILLTDLPHYASAVDDFIKVLNNKDRVKNFASYSKEIADTISAVSLSKFVIATDSALPHIAESLGIKCFSLMGPFPGRVRYSTYKNTQWIDAIKEECSPCYQHGQLPCKHSSFGGYPKCYDNIDLSKCVEKIEGMLNV